MRDVALFIDCHDAIKPGQQFSLVYFDLLAFEISTFTKMFIFTIAGIKCCVVNVKSRPTSQCCYICSGPSGSNTPILLLLRTKSCFRRRLGPDRCYHLWTDSIKPGLRFPLIYFVLITFNGSTFTTIFILPQDVNSTLYILLFG